MTRRWGATRSISGMGTSSTGRSIGAFSARTSPTAVFASRMRISRRSSTRRRSARSSTSTSGVTPPRILLPVLAALLAVPCLSGAALGESPSGHASAGEMQSLRFEKELLGSQLELAKRGMPYFQLDPWSGRLDLVVGGVVVSRFPAEKCLVGGGLRKLLQRKDPSSAIVRPFNWLALDRP